MERQELVELHQTLREQVDAVSEMARKIKWPIGNYREAVTERREAFNRYWKTGAFTNADLLAFVTRMSIHPDSGEISDGVLDFGRDFLRKSRAPGRPWVDEKRLLFVDYMILSFSPNAYLHLLRDALLINLHRLPSTAGKLQALSKSINWAETTCNRVWKIFSAKRPPVPTDWWLRPARTEIGSKALERAAAVAFCGVSKLRYSPARG